MKKSKRKDSELIQEAIDNCYFVYGRGIRYEENRVIRKLEQIKKEIEKQESRVER